MIAPAYLGDGVELYAGDCLEVMPRLRSGVHAVIADLPYATTRNTWDRAIDPKMLWHCYHSLCGPRTPMILFGSGVFTARMIGSNEAEFKYTLVWSKLAVSGHLNAKKQPLRSHEDLNVFYRQQPVYNPQMIYTGRSSHSRGSRKDRTVNHYNSFENTEVVEQDGYQYPRSIVEFARPGKPRHPTQKPVALMEWLIRTYTNPDDIVLDNVVGSGTTLVAARNAGRRAIGIEWHPEYIDMTIARLESGSEEDTWN